MILPVRDSFPSAGGAVTTERGLTGVDSRTGARVFFRDTTTFSAYTDGVGLVGGVRWLRDFSREGLAALLSEGEAK